MKKKYTRNNEAATIFQIRNKYHYPRNEFLINKKLFNSKKFRDQYNFFEISCFVFFMFNLKPWIFYINVIPF
jgi:hypothetical protein